MQFSLDLVRFVWQKNFCNERVSYNGSLPQPSKLMTGVRFPSPAPQLSERAHIYFQLQIFFRTPTSVGFSQKFFASNKSQPFLKVVAFLMIGGWNRTRRGSGYLGSPWRIYANRGVCERSPAKGGASSEIPLTRSKNSENSDLTPLVFYAGTDK